MREIVRRRRILWILVLLGVLSSGCVYYNTFFNARQSFNEAEKYRKQTGQGTQVGYKTAIDKSLKVIEEHPNSKYYDDALFVLGVSYYYTQQYNKADRRLRELLTDFPKSKFVKEGTLYLAKAKLKTGEIDAANTLFEEIVQGKYEKQFRAEAAMALGEYHSEQKDQANALRYYMAVRDSLGNEQQRLQAQRFIADDYFEEFKFADALKGYLQVLGLKPDRSQKYHALYQAAVCSYRLQRINVGLDYLAQLSKDPLFFDSLGAITLAVGEGHEDAGDIELAENVYQDVAMSSKNSVWAGEAFYRLGLIYQFDYDDVDQAKKYYDKSTQSSGGSSSGQDAKSRSTDIGRLQSLTKAGLDTTAVRMAQEGLDSLPPEDSVDVILEMKLPVPVDTSKQLDSTGTKSPASPIDSLAANKPAGKDTLRTTDSLNVAKKDTTTVIDSLKLPPHQDTVKVSDTSLFKLPVIVKDTSIHDSVAAQVDSSKSRVVAPADSGSAGNSDSAKVARVDTSAAGRVAPPPVTPQDSITAKLPPLQKANTRPDSVEAAAQARRAASADSATAKKGDSLSVKDTTTVPRDSLSNRDTTYYQKTDSAASAHSTDTTAAKNLSKSVGKTSPKPAKDSGLTREQIFKRINSAADFQYSLAELYWFQLDKPDSAIKELTELLSVFPKSDRAPEAMIALSQMYRDYKEDTVGADSLLHTVLTNYPKSDYVPVALEALGLKGTPADTGYAEYYLKRAESLLFDQKNPDSARYYYRYVVRQFPRSQLREQAAFSAIWVVENYNSPGDSSVYYAYKHLAGAFSGSPYATEASKRLTYNAPPPVKRPTSEKEKVPLTRADSILAMGKNLVGQPPTAADTAPTYIDPRQAAFIGPKKEDLIIIDLQPVQTAVEFVYPPEANDLEGDRFELYFQILLDATGKVIDLVLKVPTSSDELNNRAQVTVASMTFDPLDVSKQLQQKAINMILPEEQTDRRGRWYVFKYVITKPGYLTR